MVLGTPGEVSGEKVWQGRGGPGWCCRARTSGAGSWPPGTPKLEMIQIPASSRTRWSPSLLAQLPHWENRVVAMAPTWHACYESLGLMDVKHPRSLWDAPVRIE